VWRGDFCPGAAVRYMIPTAMDTLDPAGEFLRISERYRQMSDSELLVLVPQRSQLTPFAQDALASELRSRGLQAEAETNLEPEAKGKDGKPLASARFHPPPFLFEHESPKFRDSAGDDSLDADASSDTDPYEDPYDEERKLVDLCTVWSERDALKVQNILDVAGIPFFMGAEKATGVDEVTSNFADGVVVRIMQIGIPWSRSPMSHYYPEDDPTPKEPEEVEEVPVRCPKCRSEEVVFEGLNSEPGMGGDETSQKYEWTCDACGYRWKDDGIAHEE
jgi:DNA-directed RNA polymerase subunit M/transcription elongation factor TFIIS